MLLAIVANSIALAVADYSKLDNAGNLDVATSARNAFVNHADNAFTAFFAVECTMRIVAMGLCLDKGSYLMDPWNWIDFAVVFVGYVDLRPPRSSVHPWRSHTQCCCRCDH